VCTEGRPHARCCTPQEPSARSWPTPDEVVAKLDSKLSLTDDQKAKIKPSIADRQEKMKALANESGRHRRKVREIRSIMSESDKKIEAILNDDQKNKYEEMQQERARTGQRTEARAR